jgi:hemoglobin
MRLARLSFALVVAVLTGGCADYYYELIGRGGWPHEDYGLYSRLGGREGVDRVVDGLAETVTADPRINHYFAKTDMPRFKAKLSEQICVKTGGPCVYTGYGMKDAHAPLVVDQAAFDAFLDNLDKSLVANHVNDRDRQRLLDILAPLRSDIVKS